MESMFSQTNNLITINLSSFNTSHVTNMRCMFARCTSLNNLNLKDFDTTNVTTMNYMFDNVTAQVIIGTNWNPAMTESATGYNGSFEVKSN